MDRIPRGNENTKKRSSNSFHTQVFAQTLRCFLALGLLISSFHLLHASEVDDIIARAAIAKRILESGRLSGATNNPGYDIYLGQRDIDTRASPNHGYDIYLGQRSLTRDPSEGPELKEKRRPLYLGKRTSSWNSIPKRDSDDDKEDKRAPLYLGKRDGDRDRRFLFLGKRRPLYLGKRNSDEADFTPEEKLKDFELD